MDQGDVHTNALWMTMMMAMLAMLRLKYIEDICTLVYSFSSPPHLPLDTLIHPVEGHHGDDAGQRHKCQR